MRQDERLYRTYLEEMQSLENFKTSHGGIYKGVFDELSEDPYTKRLIESLAFFMARNRLHSERKIGQFYERLFRQYFPYLFRPLPSMGMVALHPPLDLPESVLLREGSEIAFHTQENRRAYFQTLTQTTLLPIHLHKFYVATSGSGLRASFHYQSTIARADKVGELRLYINQLNHFPSSLSLKLALQCLLDRILVSYQGDGGEEEGERATFHFEPFRSATLLNHPIEHIRSLLHLPEQEQFITIQIPPHKGRWRHLTLHLYLKEGWPKGVSLNRDSLIPFVVPIANLKRQAAEPIRSDSAKESYPILHPAPDEEFVLQNLIGVYETQGRTTPLKPTFLTKGERGYEVECTCNDGEPRYQLLYKSKDALQQPRVISVDALWTQPWFSRHLDKEIRPKIIHHALSGTEVRLIGKISPYENQMAEYGPYDLAKLLSLKNQSELEMEELFFLFNKLKKNNDSYFRDIQGFVTDLKIIKIPNSLSSNTLSIEYNFRLEEWDGKNLELVILYFRNMRAFLNSWLSNVQISIRLSSPRIKNDIIIKDGAKNEISELARTVFLHQ